MKGRYVRHIVEHKNLVNRHQRRRDEAQLRHKGDSPHGLGKQPKRNTHKVKKAKRLQAKASRQKNRRICHV